MNVPFIRACRGQPPVKPLAARTASCSVARSGRCRLRRHPMLDVRRRRGRPRAPGSRFSSGTVSENQRHAWGTSSSQPGNDTRVRSVSRSLGETGTPGKYRASVSAVSAVRRDGPCRITSKGTPARRRQRRFVCSWPSADRPSSDASPSADFLTCSPCRTRYSNVCAMTPILVDPPPDMDTGAHVRALRAVPASVVAAEDLGRAVQAAGCSHRLIAADVSRHLGLQHGVDVWLDLARPVRHPDPPLPGLVRRGS